MKSVLRIIVISLLSCTLVIFCVSAVKPARGTILLNELTDGMTVDYRLLLVSGSVEGQIDIIGLKHGKKRHDIDVVNGKFKGVVLLDKGKNRISIEAEGYKSKKISVNYQVRKSDYAVRMVYIVASDGDGTFQAPAGKPNDIASAKKRLALGGLILQSATAELMNRAGFGRKTFQLVSDPDGNVKVEIFKTNLTTEKAQAMGEQGLWHYFNRELKQAFRRDNNKVKNVALMSMTRYDSETKKVCSHTALAAGSFALFGSGGLHTWAESYDEIDDCFSDMRKPADFGLFDDSAFRKTFWANYSTGLGASLHELGHTFGIVKHSGDPQGIMERGFDRMNRIFMLKENGIPFESELIRWAPSSAEILSTSPWFK